MRRFILRRIFASLIAMFLVTIIIFSLSRLVGDPVAMLISEGGYGISETALDISSVRNCISTSRFHFSMFFG